MPRSGKPRKAKQRRPAGRPIIGSSWRSLLTRAHTSLLLFQKGMQNEDAYHWLAGLFNVLLVASEDRVEHEAIDYVLDHLATIHDRWRTGGALYMTPAEIEVVEAGLLDVEELLPRLRDDQFMQAWDKVYKVAVDQGWT